MIHGQRRPFTAELLKYYNKRYNLKVHNQLDIQINSREKIESFGPETQQSLLSHFSSSKSHDDDTSYSLKKVPEMINSYNVDT